MWFRYSLRIEISLSIENIKFLLNIENIENSLSIENIEISLMIENIEISLSIENMKFLWVLKYWNFSEYWKYDSAILCNSKLLKFLRKWSILTHKNNFWVIFSIDIKTLVLCHCIFLEKIFIVYMTNYWLWRRWLALFLISRIWRFITVRLQLEITLL